MMVDTLQTPNPFPGLRAYEPHQRDFFFGRDEQIEELLDRLQERRFLGVVGSSGSGKSSLVRAGLIPSLRSGYFARAGSQWRVALLRPGSSPKEELARSLSTAFEISNHDEVLVALNRSNLGLLDFASNTMKDGESLLLVVDQFEELFRYQKDFGDRSSDEESSAFVKLLLTASGHSEFLLSDFSELPIYVVLTMRSDFLGKCSHFRGLPEALNDSQYLVPRMTREQQQLAIEGPVEMAGAKITTQLVQRLLNDVGNNPDQLPVLQHVLMRTWEESAETRSKGAAIDILDYTATGEMKDALNIDADRTLGKVTADDTKFVRRIFQRLVEASAKDEETRRPTPLSELTAVTGAPEKKVLELVEVFRKDGFLTISEDDDPIIDITHESLIRLWTKLRKWVAEEKESCRVYSRLAQSAQIRTSLYRDPELSEALRWKDAENPNDRWADRYFSVNSLSFAEAMEFLKKSKRARLRRQALAIGVFAVVCVLAFGVFVLWRRAKAFGAEAAEQRNIALVQKLGAVADALGKEHGGLNERSLLLATEALRRSETSSFENTFAFKALYQALSRSPVFVSRMKHDDRITSLRFSPDGKFLLSGSKGNDKTARVWDVQSGREIARLPDQYGVMDVFLSPNGRYLATTSGDRYRDPKERVIVETPGVLTVSEWDGTRLGKMIQQRDFDKQVVTARFDETSSRLFAADINKLVAVHLDHPTKSKEKIISSTMRPILSERAPLLATARQNQSIQIMDLESLQTVNTFSLPASPFKTTISPVLFPDNKVLAVRSMGGTHFVNPVSGRRVGQVEERRVTSFAFSHNGQLLASFDHFDGLSISTFPTDEKLWNVETEGGEGNPRVLFSPDDKLVAVFGIDFCVRVYDVAHRSEIFRISAQSQATHIALSDNGELAVGEVDGTITVWRLLSGSEYHLDYGTPNFSPQGMFVAFRRDNDVSVWDRKNGRHILEFKGTKKENNDSFSPSDVRYTFSQDDHYFAFAELEKIRWFDLVQKQELPPISAVSAGNAVSSLQFDPSGLLVVATTDNKITKWSLDGEPSRSFGTGSPEMWFSRYARFVATLLDDEKKYELWDVEHGISLGKVYADLFGWALNFSPDENLFAILSPEQKVVVYKTDSLKELWRSNIEVDYTTSIMFSPDCRSLAVFEGQDIYIWDAATGQVKATLRRESSGQDLTFSPDSKRIAASYDDNSVCIWSPDNATILAQFTLEPTEARLVRFSPDGKFLVAEDSRKAFDEKGNEKKETVFRTLWWEPQDLINEACKRVSRNLTRDEWERYLPTETYRKTCENLP